MLTSVVSCKMVLANTDDPQTKHCTLWKHFVFFPLMCPYIASLPAIHALFYTAVLILVHTFEI